MMRKRGLQSLKVVQLLPISWHQRMSCFSVYNRIIDSQMEELVSSVLRPYRCSYTLADLGHKNTPKYTRIDDSILNDRDLQIRYSYYAHKMASTTCVLYCHCNSGSRVQGASCLPQFIQRGWNVCLFDFTGSGQSQGEFISLGHYQSQDLDLMVKRARALGNKDILLWGRSMGAATIIFYLSQAKQREAVAACVLDSPYASLWNLIKQLGVDRSIIPAFILEHLLDYLRAKIKEDHCFDIKSLQPLKCIGSVDIPLFFITSCSDQFVRSEDVAQLYRLAASKNKQLEYIDKGHNCSREASTIKLAAGFLSKCVAERQKKSRLLKVCLKNCKYVNGGNMAELIVRAEKERSEVKRMKSQVHLDKSFKENKSKFNNVHLKTEFTSNPSIVLCRKEDRSPLAAKKKAIKYSLAHLQMKKKSGSLLDSTLM